jgi:hypothetical protein
MGKIQGRLIQGHLIQGLFGQGCFVIGTIKYEAIIVGVQHFYLIKLRGLRL